MYSISCVNACFARGACQREGEAWGPAHPYPAKRRLPHRSVLRLSVCASSLRASEAESVNHSSVDVIQVPLTVTCGCVKSSDGIGQRVCDIQSHAPFTLRSAINTSCQVNCSDNAHSSFRVLLSCDGPAYFWVVRSEQDMGQALH